METRNARLITIIDDERECRGNQSECGNDEMGVLNKEDRHQAVFFVLFLPCIFPRSPSHTHAVF